MSQRRACAIVGQHRSTQRYEPAEPDPDSSLRAELRGFAELTGPRFLVQLMCAPFFGLCLWESGGVWLLVASLELGG